MDGSGFNYTKPAEHGPDTFLLLMDCSGSMQGGNFAMCKRVIRDAICPNPTSSNLEDRESLIPDNVLLGLREFGEYSPAIADPCMSTELVVRPGLANRSQILDKLDSVSFGNSTPLTRAIKQIPYDLARSKGGKHVILFTDGDGTCPNEDACNALRQVRKDTGAEITIIGLRGVNEDLLKCVNEIPGCRAIPATAENLGEVFGSAIKYRIHGEVLNKHSFLYNLNPLHWLHNKPAHAMDKMFAFLKHKEHQCNCHSNKSRNVQAGDSGRDGSKIRE